MTPVTATLVRDLRDRAMEAGDTPSLRTVKQCARVARDEKHALLLIHSCEYNSLNEVLLEVLIKRLQELETRVDELERTR